MLQTLELNNFRSYKNGLFGFEPGVNIIVGANASGKTNLLEAIHVICTLQGFRAADKDLITTGAEWSRLEALTDNGVRIAKLKLVGGKQLDIDGVAKKRLTPETALPVVVFEPEHMLLLSSEPERRRAYLDGILSQTKPGYHSALLAYKRALSQRNRLLKNDRLESSQLFVWDVQLAEKAGVLVKARLELIETIKDVVNKQYKALSNSKAELDIRYKTKLDQGNYIEEMLTYLKHNMSLDRQRGFTTAGPHRDDLEILLNDNDARTLASRGETRTIILSLKIAELELLEQQTGKKPILLLDDVFSELDGSRRRALAENLKNYQTLLTTTDADVAVDHFSAYNIIPVLKS